MVKLNTVKISIEGVDSETNQNYRLDKTVPINEINCYSTIGTVALEFTKMLVEIENKNDTGRKS